MARRRPQQRSSPGLRGAFRQVLIGLIIGIPISIACGRLMAAQLYQVRAGIRWYSPPHCGAGILRDGGQVIPAQRAASINPFQPLVWNDVRKTCAYKALEPAS